MSATEMQLQFEQAPLIPAKAPPESRPAAARLPLETSQNGKILAKLKSMAGRWVAMPELAACSGSYNVHSRIADLRIKFGLTIENRTDTTVKPHRSDYRILLA